MDTKISFYHCLIILSVTFGIAGCGNGLVPLRGKVTYSDDGSPLTMGYVYFDNGKELARGKINADGTYVVGSRSANDGLAPGSYKIYVQATGPDPSGAVETVWQSGPASGQPQEAGTGLRRQVPLVDSKFTSSATSGLKLNVDRTTKSHDIVVDKSPYLKQK